MPGIKFVSGDSRRGFDRSSAGLAHYRFTRIAQLTASLDLDLEANCCVTSCGRLRRLGLRQVGIGTEAVASAGRGLSGSGFYIYAYGDFHNIGVYGS